MKNIQLTDDFTPSEIIVEVKVEQPNISLCWEVSHEESKHKQIDLKNIDKVLDNGALLYLIWEK